MEPVEWCSLRTAPVYPLRTLLRIDPSGRERSSPSKRRAIRSAFPWPLEGHTVRVLPRLHAVVVIPDAPPADIVGAPIPAIALDRLMRRKGRVFTNRRHRRTAIVETAYGFDRYDIAPSGLVRCIANVTPPSGTARWCPPAGRRRGRVTRRRSAKKRSFRRSDRFALASAALAVAIIVTPAPRSPSIPAATSNGAAEIVTAPARPGVQPEAFLVESFPGGRVSRVAREGDHVSVTVVAPVAEGYVPPLFNAPYPPSIDSIEVIHSGREMIVSTGWSLR